MCGWDIALHQPEMQNFMHDLFVGGGRPGLFFHDFSHFFCRATACLYKSVNEPRLGYSVSKKKLDLDVSNHTVWSCDT